MVRPTTHRVSAVVAAMGLVVITAGAAVPSSSAGSSASAPRLASAGTCAFLQVGSTLRHGRSTLFRVEMPSGRRTKLASLDYEIEALGYSPEQRVAYGIADTAHRGHQHWRRHLVTITPSGTVTDRGPIPRGGHFGDVAAGAVSGEKLYLRDLLRLHSVDVSPVSATYGQVTTTVRLSPAVLAYSVDDFAADPSDGMLYGISTLGTTARVVRIDPATGRISIVTDVPALPWMPSYGSVVLESPGTLAVVHNRFGEAAELYRVRFDGSAELLSSSEQVWHSDAAGCLDLAEPPPPPPSPSPSTTPTPTPPAPAQTPTPTPAPTSPPVSAPVAPPTDSPAAPTPSDQVPVPSRPPRPTPPRPLLPPPPPPSELPLVHSSPIPRAASSTEPGETVKVLRRWSLATLLMVLIGGAAAAAQARSRGRR
ncbi:hypothetical protein AB0P21_39985 [Kribbella sp. NPDC056861]|uniref:DUF6923 family protein n=1 Tax=Kribbella sp. NPDC056861 TaxID=3154857 RepID=UPI00341A9740